jgi:methylenetetrahydrofolate reductase (NADPH)
VRVSHFYARPEPVISFEFFPPKNAEAVEALFRDTVPALKRLKPAFISVTYGAGGSTRATTMGVVGRVKRDFGIEAIAHLTCVGATRDVLTSILAEAESLDVENILCLRGDPPKDLAQLPPADPNFRYAIDLIRFVKERGRFDIGAACYPEGHVECPDKRLDWDRAADKVEAGAQVLITQLFYDWNDFLEMEDYLRNKRGVKVPIVPGVLPILNTAQIKRFTALCGSKLPAPLLARLEKHAADDEAVRQIGVEVATETCYTALKHGVGGIHFYCLNRAQSCTEVIGNLGLVREAVA